jgi:hypothetical protein
MSNGSISKKEIPTPEKGIRKKRKKKKKGYEGAKLITLTPDNIQCLYAIITQNFLTKGLGALGRGTHH